MSIKIKLETSGSEYGNSYYGALLSCPRRARLAKERKAMRTATVIEGNLGIGTLGHGYMEAYYSGQISSPEDLKLVEFEPKDPAIDLQIDPAAQQEAMRVMAEYMTQFAATSYGEVLFTEREVPATASERDIVHQAVGITPWTGRIDMGVRLKLPTTPGKKRASPAAALQERFGLDVRPGAKYLVDFKFYGQESKTLRENFLMSDQCITYQLAMNAVEVAAGREPFAGMIFDVIIKTKQPKFLRFLAEPPTDVEIGILQERWRAVGVFATHLADWPNIKECVPFIGAPCGFHLDGSCDRGAEAGLVQLGGGK